MLISLSLYVVAYTKLYIVTVLICLDSFAQSVCVSCPVINILMYIYVLAYCADDK